MSPLASASPSAIAVRPPPGSLDARVRPPGSKSLSNRALLLAAMARGESQLEGLLDAEDTRLMWACLRALGLELGDFAIDARIPGRGARLGRPDPDADPDAPAPELFVGTAGTVARFLVAVLAATGAAARVDGSPRMRERPMAALLQALRGRGARIQDLGAPDALPIFMGPGDGYRGGEIHMQRPRSSQFVSALALAAVFADAPTRIVLEGGSPARPYIDMTLETMRRFGFRAAWVDAAAADPVIEIEPGEGEGKRYAVEPDASAASYLLAAAAIYGGRVEIPQLGRNSLQGDAAFAEVLARFGARAEREADCTRVFGTGELRGLDLDLDAMPDMTLTAAVVAAHAKGPTRIRGVEVLRHHESDRIAAGASELRKLGCEVQEYEGGLDIHPPAQLRRGAQIETYLDHRMAMAFALAGELEILDPGCAAKTYPRYFEVLAELGMCEAEAARAVSHAHAGGESP